MCTVGSSEVEFGATCNTEIPDKQNADIKIDKSDLWLFCWNR